MDIKLVNAININGTMDLDWESIPKHWEVIDDATSLDKASIALLVLPKYLM